MASKAFVPMEMKTCVVKAWSYENRNLRGSLYNPFFPEEQPFESQSQLFFMMDKMFDSLKFPQRTMQCRKFSSAAEAMEAAAAAAGDEKMPILATFNIKVLFRQNASWQGRLTWMEKQLEADFRSVLELCYIIDSALEPGEGDEDN